MFRNATKFRCVIKVCSIALSIKHNHRIALNQKFEYIAIYCFLKMICIGKKFGCMFKIKEGLYYALRIVIVSYIKFTEIHQDIKYIIYRL